MSGDYAGDVSPSEAWAMLEQDSAAVLVDVRSDAEWRHVGLPDLDNLGKQTVCAAWQCYPDMRQNQNFIEEVRLSGVSPDQKVLLLCRSGVRSRYAAAALTAQGFGHCYNITEGFEGPPDDQGHRSTQAGWKFAGLPWRQE